MSEEEIVRQKGRKESEIIINPKGDLKQMDFSRYYYDDYPQSFTSLSFLTISLFLPYFSFHSTSH